MEYIRSEVNSLGALNAELEKIETALDSKVSTEASGPRVMHADLDMNSNNLLNLPKPESPTEPVRLVDIPDLVEQSKGSLYVGETAPIAPFQGLRWYNPSVPATYVYYEDGDSGQWVQEAHEGVDGALRSDLASATSEVLVGGTEAGKLAGKVASFVSILDFIPKSQWAAIFNYTSNYDCSDAFQAAMNSNSYVNVIVPRGKYRITKTLNVTTQLTLTGEEGGSQSMQSSWLYHDPSSTGNLFNVTTLVDGACIKNFRIYGGNGSTCIVNAIPQVRYEYLYFREYNGGGIQLRSDFVIGSSSIRIRQCEWLGINSPTDHIGYDIDCNGGDVLLEGVTAIRGSRGIDIKQGQTIRVIGCSVNKQSVYNNFSSRTGANTAGIRLSGSGYKESIEISGCYIEACTNGVYVEKCESLSIKNNLFQDVGVAGVVGPYEQFGNNSINILGSNCQNVTIENNFIRADSNGKSGVDTFYAVRVGSGASGVNFFNNIVKTIGDVSAQYTFSSPVNALSNTYIASSNPRPNSGTGLVTELNVGLKAFARFTGTGSVSNLNSYAITSVVRTGAGQYTITTASDWPNATVSVAAENGAVQQFFLHSVLQTSNNTFVLSTGTNTTTLADARQISFVVHG